MLSSVSAWLSGPRAGRQLALIVFLVSLPAIRLGMIGDDYDLAAAVAQDPLSAYAFWPADPEQLRLVRARGLENGTLAWWTSDHFRQRFMRPVASLSHALDFTLFRDAPWLMHVENSLLYAGIVLLYFTLLHALGMPAAPLGLATFFYAWNGHQALTVGWIAGRNTLLAAAFGLLAITLHVRARARESGAWLALAVLSFALCLLCAEGGVAAFGYLFAHACFLDRGALGARLLRLWPYLLVIAGWRVAYTAGGYGVVGSGFYRDPGSDPLGFVVGVANAIPIYLGSQLTVPYASMAGLSTRATVIGLVASLAILFALHKLVLHVLVQDRRARFLGLGALLSIVPLGTTLPQDRLVFFVGLGVSGVLALIVHDRLRAESTQPKRGARALWVMHGLAQPLLFVPVLFGNMNQVMGGGARELDRALPRRADAHVVLLNGPSHLPVHFQRRMRLFRGETELPEVDMLYAGAGEAIVRRVDEHTLELSVERGWVASTIGALTRDLRRDPFHVGQVLERPRMRVVVLAVDERSAPQRVRFELRPAAGKPRFFYAWRGRRVAPVELPPIGHSLVLAGISPV